MLVVTLEKHIEPYEKSSPLIKWYLDSIEEEHILSNSGYKFLREQHLYEFAYVRAFNGRGVPLLDNEDPRERKDFAGYLYKVDGEKYLVTSCEVWDMQEKVSLTLAEWGGIAACGPVYIDGVAFHFDFATLFNKPTSEMSRLEMKAFGLFKHDVKKIVGADLTLMPPTTYVIRPLSEHSKKADGIIYNSSKGCVYINKYGHCFKVGEKFEILDPINHSFDSILTPLLTVFKYELETTQAQ